MAAGYLQLTPAHGGNDFSPAGSFSVVFLLENFDAKAEDRYICINGTTANAGWALWQHGTEIRATVWDAGGLAYSIVKANAFIDVVNQEYRMKVLVALVYDQPNGDLYIKFIRSQYNGEAVQSDVNVGAPAVLRTGTVGLAIGAQYGNPSGKEWSGGIFWGGFYPGYKFTDANMLTTWAAFDAAETEDAYNAALATLYTTFPAQMLIWFADTPDSTYTSEIGSYVFDVINKEFFRSHLIRDVEDSFIQLNTGGEWIECTQEVAYTTEPVTPTGSFSIAVYVRLFDIYTDATAQGLFCRVNASPQNPYWLGMLNTGANPWTLTCGVSTGGYGAGINTGIKGVGNELLGWKGYPFLAVMTYEFLGHMTSQLKLYVNDTLIAQNLTAIGPVKQDSIEPLIIGRQGQYDAGTRRAFCGNVYWAGMWFDKVLTPTELTALSEKTSKPWEVDLEKLRFLWTFRPGTSIAYGSEIGGLPMSLSAGLTYPRGVTGGNNPLPLFNDHHTLKDDLVSCFPFHWSRPLPQNLMTGDIMGLHYAFQESGDPEIIIAGGKFLNAVEFDGDDRVSFDPTMPVLSSWAISFWVWHPAGAWAATEGFFDTSFGNAGFASTGHPAIAPPINLTHTDQLSVDQWHHLVFMCETGVGSTIVIDGDWAARAHNANTWDATPLYVGWGNGAFLTGRIEQFCVHKRVLTQQEIEDLWNNGNGLSYLPG